MKQTFIVIMISSIGVIFHSVTGEKQLAYFLMFYFMAINFIEYRFNQIERKFLANPDSNFNSYLENKRLKKRIQELVKICDEIHAIKNASPPPPPPPPRE